MPIIDKKQLFKRIESFDAALELVVDEYNNFTGQELDIKAKDIPPEIAGQLILAASNLVVAHNVNHVGATIYHAAREEGADR